MLLCHDIAAVAVPTTVTPGDHRPRAGTSRVLPSVGVVVQSRVQCHVHCSSGDALWLMSATRLFPPRTASALTRSCRHATHCLAIADERRSASPTALTITEHAVGTHTQTGTRAQSAMPWSVSRRRQRIHAFGNRPASAHRAHALAPRAMPMARRSTAVKSGHSRAAK